jgi:hypothetical protein
MAIADVIMYQHRWLDVGAGLFAVLAFALDLTGIGGPRL